MTEPIYAIISPAGWAVEVVRAPDGRWRASIDLPDGYRLTGRPRDTVRRALADVRSGSAVVGVVQACDTIAKSHEALH